MRLLNMSSTYNALNIYLSKEDESFAEATLLGEMDFAQMSDNMKFEQEDYIYYITSSLSDEIIYQSDAVSYSSTSQYLMVVRDSLNQDTSALTLDWIKNANTVEYPNTTAKAQLKVFNAIKNHDLLPNYQGDFDFHFGDVDDTPEFSSVSYGQLSDALIVKHADYSVELVSTVEQVSLINNHLLTLGKDVNKTAFFYLIEQDVDNDNDGDVDENGDGIVDEIEVSIQSLVVNNSQRTSIYDHQLQIVNLVKNDKFTQVKFYFVKSNELIDSAKTKTTVNFGTADSVTLLNNTYMVYAIARVDDSAIILASEELTLDETSKELFLILDTTSSEQYTMSFINQN